jgi:hypothetical protein
LGTGSAGGFLLRRCVGPGTHAGWRLRPCSIGVGGPRCSPAARPPEGRTDARAGGRSEAAGVGPGGRRDGCGDVFQARRGAPPPRTIRSWVGAPQRWRGWRAGGPQPEGAGLRGAPVNLGRWGGERWRRCERAAGRGRVPPRADHAAGTTGAGRWAEVRTTGSARIDCPDQRGPAGAAGSDGAGRSLQQGSATRQASPVPSQFGHDRRVGEPSVMIRAMRTGRLDRRRCRATARGRRRGSRRIIGSHQPSMHAVARSTRPDACRPARCWPGTGHRA